MAKLKTFYKIVTPAPQVKQMQDSEDMSGGSAYGSNSWYQRLIQGSATRITRYREYDIMDDDVDISLALDTIAEDMTACFANTQIPFRVELLQNLDDLHPTLAHTLNFGLKKWCEIHNWKTRLFPVARMMIKYGDAFFKKQGLPDARWEFVHPRQVHGAVVNKDDMTDVIGWQISKDIKESNGSFYSISTQYNNNQMQTEPLDAKEVVRFTTNDDMSMAAPFGESVLRPVFRSHKQKVLLEDAIIIYRIVRAPERRIFQIDVGNMPNQRIKNYLEQIKNDMRQKKIPSRAGSNQVESVYNPHSMQEDFFFARRADGKGSEVSTLPGGQNLGELSDLEYFEDKVARGLRIPASYYSRRTNQQNPIFNDGRAGQAYIEEVRFSNYVERLQHHLQEVMDKEFKMFLQDIDINVSSDLFELRMHEPTNFAKYRQQELDKSQLDTLNAAKDYPILSKRFVLAKYLQMSTTEVAENERLLAEEKGVDVDDPNFVQKIYNTEEDFGGAGGGFGSSGSSTDMTADFGDGDLGGDELGGDDTDTGADDTTADAPELDI